MSVFLCSDKQFAAVAKGLFSSRQAQQLFADKLKRENLLSVNQRYRETTRFRKVDLNAVSDEEMKGFFGHDILALLTCIDYQSDSRPEYDDTSYSLAFRLLEWQGARRQASSCWSI